MDPAAVALEREDRVAGRAQQAAVVADQQHGLAAALICRSSSCLAGMSRKLSGSSSSSAGASEENSSSSTSRLRSPPESVFAARSPTSASAVADLPAGGVPLALELVAAEVRPHADRLAEPHAGALVAAPRVALGGEHPEPRVAYAGRRELSSSSRTVPSPVPTSWAMETARPPI